MAHIPTKIEYSVNIWNVIFRNPGEPDDQLPTANGRSGILRRLSADQQGTIVVASCRLESMAPRTENPELMHPLSITLNVPNIPGRPDKPDAMCYIRERLDDLLREAPHLSVDFAGPVNRWSSHRSPN